MKNILRCDLSQVGLLASANLGLSAVAEWVGNLQALVQVLVGLGQLVVAVVTALYIAKKIRKLKKDE